MVLVSKEELPNNKACDAYVWWDFSLSMNAQCAPNTTRMQVALGVVKDLLDRRVFRPDTSVCTFGFPGDPPDAHIKTVSQILQQSEHALYGATYTRSLTMSFPLALSHSPSDSSKRVFLIGDGAFSDSFTRTVEELFEKEPTLRTHLLSITLVLIDTDPYTSSRICRDLTALICESKTAVTIDVYPIKTLDAISNLRIKVNTGPVLPPGSVSLGPYYTTEKSPVKLVKALEQLSPNELDIILNELGDNVLKLAQFNPDVLTRNPVYSVHWQILKILKNMVLTSGLTVEQAFISKLPSGFREFRQQAQVRPVCGDVLVGENVLATKFIQFDTKSMHTSGSLIPMSDVFTPRDGTELDGVLKVVFGTNARCVVVPHNLESCLPLLTRKDFTRLEAYAERQGQILPNTFTFEKYLEKFWRCLFRLFGHMFQHPDRKGTILLLFIRPAVFNFVWFYVTFFF